MMHHCSPPYVAHDYNGGPVCQDCADSMAEAAWNDAQAEEAYAAWMARPEAERETLFKNAMGVSEVPF